MKFELRSDLLGTLGAPFELASLPAVPCEHGGSNRGGRYVRDEPVRMDDYAALPWAA